MIEKNFVVSQLYRNFWLSFGLLIISVGIFSAWIFFEAFDPGKSVHTAYAPAAKKRVREPMFSSDRKEMAVTEEFWMGTKGKCRVPLNLFCNDVTFVGENTRPDRKMDHKMSQGRFGQGRFGIVMPGSRDLLYLDKGEKYFLRLEKEGGESKVRISAEETPLVLQIREGQAAQLGIELQLSMKDLGFETEPNQVCRVNLSPSQGDYVDMAGFRQAKKALDHLKIYPPDQLIEVWGGGAFSELKGRPRVINCCDECSTYQFISNDDHFVLNGEGKWVIGRDEGYLAHVGPIEGGRVKISLWDPTGTVHEVIEKNVESGGMISLNTQKLLSNIHPRTHSSISCQFEGKNFAFKAGDWIFLTDKSISNVKKTDELLDILKFKKKGYLLIFDGLKKVDELTYFTGFIFNESRTSFKQIELPINEGQVKSIDFLKKKKGLSGSIDRNGIGTREI
ncbi:MAG: hypothetical protein S4CHLAM102_07620 [Chlamydiia bacterium]|nr:hypothetical protein [Chlamydiia bacterium]